MYSKAFMLSKSQTSTLLSFLQIIIVDVLVILSFAGNIPLRVALWTALCYSLYMRDAIVNSHAV